MEMHVLNRHYGRFRIVFHILIIGLFISILRLPLTIKGGLFVVAVLAFAWLYRAPVVGESMYGEQVGGDEMVSPHHRTGH